jgi:peptide deformylase
MAVLPIAIYPDPILRERALPVEKVDVTIQKLIQDMIETMHAAPGIGLAAPQVSVSRQVIVVDTSVGEDPAALHVLINPQIVAMQGAVSEEEGCLSLPEVRVEVPRAAEVTVQGLNAQGERMVIHAEGLLARVFQHEIDHLHGRLIIDYLGKAQRDLIKQKLRKQRQKEETKKVVTD